MKCVKCWEKKLALKKIERDFWVRACVKVDYELSVCTRMLLFQSESTERVKCCIAARLSSVNKRLEVEYNCWLKGEKFCSVSVENVKFWSEKGKKIIERKLSLSFKFKDQFTCKSLTYFFVRLWFSLHSFCSFFSFYSHCENANFIHKTSIQMVPNQRFFVFAFPFWGCALSLFSMVFN